ncbi:MAG: hypothetical protein KGL39_47940 [Patescibacteria group bacterium]|nr:hypothetical protein [Patescibacteria group bacterium]
MRNGAGTYILPAGNPVVTNTTISSTWANTTLSDIGAALTQSLSNDGQTPVVANLPMATFKHTNVAPGYALTDYARYDQLQNSTPQWMGTATGTDAIKATLTPAPTALTEGMTLRFLSAGANATTAVTLQINALTAVSVVKNGAAPLAVGDIPANGIVTVTYDGTNFQLVTVINIAMLDARYGPLKINTLSANTTLDATYQGSVNNITAITTQTLPALSTLASGQTYVIDFESQVINALVACNAADSMTVNGISAQSQWPMNPGSYLRCVGIGGTAGAWVCKYVPAAEGFDNSGSTSDIVLHVGEKCRYAPASVGNLLLHIASGNAQRYRFLISSTAAGQAVHVLLAVNNTTYTSGVYGYSVLRVSSARAFNGTWDSGTTGIMLADSMLAQGLCDATVCTDTTAKTAISIESQADGTTGFMGITTTNSSDTTTVWSSLGTILNCPSGSVTVERIQ